MPLNWNFVTGNQFSAANANAVGAQSDANQAAITVLTATKADTTINAPAVRAQSATIVLDNANGGARYSNSGAAMAYTSYTVATSPTLGAIAYLLCNTATPPSFANASKVGDFDTDWPVSTDVIVAVYELFGSSYVRILHNA